MNGRSRGFGMYLSGTVILMSENDHDKSVEQGDDADAFSGEAFIKRLRALRELRQVSEEHGEAQPDKPELLEDASEKPIPVFTHVRRDVVDFSPSLEKQGALQAHPDDSPASDIDMHAIGKCDANFASYASGHTEADTGVNRATYGEEPRVPEVERKPDDLETENVPVVVNSSSKAQDVNLNAVRSQMASSLSRKKQEQSGRSPVILLWLLRCFTNVYFLLLLLVTVMYFVARYAS